MARVEELRRYYINKTYKLTRTGQSYAWVIPARLVRSLAPNCEHRVIRILDILDTGELIIKIECE